MWQDDENVSKEFDEANSYCQNKTLGGYNDWRLPTINELLSIINYQRYSRYYTDSLNTFQNHKNTKYWTSTHKEGNNSSSSIWSVNFNNGHTGTDLNTSSGIYIKCVRRYR